MDCDCLIHPFQNDPGTSQRQRVMDDLLSGAAKIDGRTLADLLDYFVQMSRHINYYDLRLNVQDWQPFFKNSVPFTLASVIRFPLQNTEASLTLYKCIFERRPSPAGLQLLVFSIYYRFINNINNWHRTLQDSSLPFVSTTEGLIKNKLQKPVQQFIGLTNAAVKKYGISRIDFLKLSENPVWGLSTTMINAADSSFSAGTASAHQRMLNLYNDLFALLTVFEDAIKTLSAAAEKNLELSFVPLKEELQKKHSPHLALLFAFLNMFRQLQNDLNQYTRKHLDYFYKNILQFQSGTAIPDKANIVFEIQKALKNYLVKKGLRVKDGKDIKSQDIIFSSDDDIVVTQTTIADKKTLFLNNQVAHVQTYVEGVYMASAADMADGVDKPFSDDPKNFPTLGAHYSKYADPETKIIKPYPNARLGFILASPVLLLQSGSTRHIHIDLSCTLLDSICKELGNSIVQDNKNCCNDQVPNPPPDEPNPYPEYLSAKIIFPYVKDHINRKYIYISEDLFKQAVKKGFTKDFIDDIRVKFLQVESTVKPCYCDSTVFKSEESVLWASWNNFINTKITDPLQRKLLDEIFPPQKILNLGFSGEKNWIIPHADDYHLKLEPLAPNGIFTIRINLTLPPETESIVNYSKETLIEDYGTVRPVVKIQLNDKIKVKWKIAPDPLLSEGDPSNCCIQDDNCCLLYDPGNSDQLISYYHFFRNVIVNQEDNTIPVIRVNVCGLKNFIVQNDETVMDVNGPVYPFGTRPEIINFDVNNPPATPLIGPGFYIGSEEIFFKKWDYVRININWKDKPAHFTDYYGAYIKGGIKEADFKMMVSVLDKGEWKGIGSIEKLFDNSKFWTAPPATEPHHHNCTHINPIDQHYIVYASSAGIDREYILDQHLNKKLESSTLNGFLKINLVNQDFLHKIYAFVLARQMMALGRLPQVLLTGAVYKDNSTNTVFVFSDAFGIIDDLETAVQATKTSADATALLTNNNIVAGDVGSKNPANADALDTQAKATQADTDVTNLKALNSLLSFFTGPNKDKLEALIPNEPWTPVISKISLDYSAVATMSDIDLIHLYPYYGTYKAAPINLTPTLFPEFCDEGTLFLGLQGLVPGDNLNILFQLAEATSDSESDPEKINWYYLDSNNWKPLRTGFEVLDDGTKNLTSSGIIKFALPANMTNNNTVMPTGMHWIKAAIPQNSGSVSETTGILTQAIQVIFTNDDANDKLRLAKPLTAGSISKLEEADASVKSVSQPYDSFGGLVPEIQQQFYVRVSETLRHKGRAIQAFDYERLVLQAFPQLFKVKCINHSFALNAHEYKNDFPYAPGYVLLAVIPDLNQLKAGNSYEPKVPVSIIEDIDAYIRKRSSPFVRFRAMNPRYEKINFCLRIRLVKGKDENYYKEKLKEDISEFLAPWAVGEFSKLTFGQCVYRSDIIVFLETRDYVDYIGDLQMGRDGIAPSQDIPKVCPTTPRSILIAGNIEVCINPPDCETWGNYYACDDQIPVLPCNTKAEKIMDYCKKTEQ